MNRATLSLETLLRAASAELESGGLLELVRLPAREGAGRKLDPPLPGTLRRRLARKGIEELWSHQAEAIEAVRRGENVVVSTGTASGKSLVFNLPVFETMLADGAARALYLYPTKALAQDQLRAIRSFAIPSITAATYDGDTPMEERPSVRKFAGIVLSNPDMLHFGIIPAHRQWAQFFSGLRFVVVDETHILRGVFGSHVGCILRRLRRIARHYGADPQFIMTSATIGNPGDLAGRLAGADFTEITRDGAPKGERLFGFWNPPFIDEARGIRSSTNWESARLVSHLASSGVHTIAFAKSRKSAELIAKHARTLVHTDDVAARIRSYRAGYLAEDRREIEKQLFSGELLAVAATSALELGIDVGGLDAVVMNGFPGTVAQVWQQAGRAGRQAGEAAAVLVGRDDPLDQYYVRHPDVLLSKPYEAALVDTTNPNILRPHLGCAAYELPLDSQVVDELFGEGASAVADAMLEAGDLVLRVGASRRRLHWKRRTPPGRELDIRSAGGPVYSIVEEA
ncbi:MAG: DEAD/DEAH box helicase, partial [Actinomycetota bacterium]